MKRLIPMTVACATLFTIVAGTCAENNVRGMYVEQEHNPTVKKNTGLCYWLELKRDGETKRVTNKTAFRNGDKLRIHVKPNVEAYAYILMLQGSKGDKAVLFPNEDLKQNKIHAGSWMTLPVAKGDDEAWLKFDKNPGTEVLRMIVSRNKIDPEEQLHGGSVVIASGSDGDKVPDGTLVAITVTKGTKVSGSRNLTVETESKDKEAGETTVVGGADKQLAVDITLNHTSD